GENASLPLHRLSDCDRHRVSRFAAGGGRNAESERAAQDLYQDHRRERPTARAGVLRPMRYPALFDLPRQWGATVLCVACGRFAPARPAHAAAANLVAFVATMGDAARRVAQTLEARLGPAKVGRGAGS